MNFDFIVSTCKHRRPTLGAEVASRMIARFALKADGLLWENRGCIKQRTVMFATVQAVAKTDSVRAAPRCEPDSPAAASTGKRSIILG